jgi:predicted membrane protein
MLVSFPARLYLVTSIAPRDVLLVSVIKVSRTLFVLLALRLLRMIRTLNPVADLRRKTRNSKLGLVPYTIGK